VDYLKACIALGYGLNDRGLEFRQGLIIFLLTTASRTVLGPIQPPIQWVPGCEADHSTPSSAEVRHA
jgi:hypothetical protein